MCKKIQDGFIFSAAIILFIAAAGKVYGAAGTADALNSPDPLIPLSTRYLFLATAFFDLFLSAFFLVKGGNQTLKLSAIAWLASNYLCYSIALWWNGSPNYFDCLSYLNGSLFLSPRVLSAVGLATLIWLAAGSYSFLFLGWLAHRKISRAAKAPAIKESPIEA